MSKSSRKPNMPFKVTTKSLAIRRAIAALLTVLAIFGIGYFIWSNTEPSQQEPQTEQQTQEQSSEEPGFDGEAEQISFEDAASTIRRYYESIATRNASNLREMGYHSTATAIEQGWLDNIHYTVKGMPEITVSDFPEANGTYAGNTMYAISSFCSGAGTSSDITGESPYIGWIYYDAVTSSWAIVDPTIPTSIQIPASNNVIRSSQSNSVTTTVNSSGVYCNPWWAFTKQEISINTTGSASSSPVSFDNGVTIDMPDNLVSGSLPSGETKVTVTMYRGQLDNFSPDRIGQQDQSLQGDIFPLIIESDGEICSPIFDVTSSS